MPQLYKVIVLLFLYFCNILPVLASGSVPDKAGGTTGNGPYIAYEPVLDMRVTLYTGSERPETILEKLSEKTGLIFSYETTRLQHLPAFKASWKDERLGDCLEQLLQGSGLVFIVNGKEIIIKRKSGSRTYTICGSICDDVNGETLMGVTLLMKDNATGTRSNAYGFYSLYLPAGHQRVGISCVGYETIDTVLNISHDEVLNIRMRPGLTGLGQVIITGYDARKAKQQAVGIHSLSIQEIKAVPALMGEPDVMKVMQQLPGIQASVDGMSGLHVRGGAEDQNLILMDEAPVYNPSHAIGFFSIFNPDVVKSADVYMGSIPAKYGERLSSVLDVRLKEGNTERTSVSGSIGTISSRLMVEGPLGNGKGSWLVAGRYSYIGAVMNSFHELVAGLSLPKDFNDYEKGNKVSFYDMNLKGNYKLSEADRLYISVYSGNDRFYMPGINTAARERWGNVTTTLRWNHIYNTRLFSNTSIAYSRYHYESDLQDKFTSFSWKSGFRKIDIRHHFDYYKGNGHHREFGMNVGFQKIQPGKVIDAPDAFSMETKYVLEPSFYYSDIFQASPRITIDYGLRISYSANTGKGTEYEHSKDDTIDTIHYQKGVIHHMYVGLEPRLAGTYRFSEKTVLKLAYARTRQHMRLLSNSLISSPTAIWYPSNELLPVQSADNFSAGVYCSLARGKLQLAVDAYYKLLYDQTDYIDNANLQLNNLVDFEMLVGRGRARGIEVFLKKEKGRLSGWISYSLSSSQLQVDEINYQKWYSTPYDRPHRISNFISYQTSKRSSVSATFTYVSGGRMTVPAGQFIYNGTLYNYYDERNGYKMRDHHRLDLSFILRSKPHRNWAGEWNLSIYNAYNRRNVSSIILSPTSENYPTAPTVYEVHVFNLLPSLSYNFKF